MKSIRNDSVCRPAALVTAILSCAVAYATVRTNTFVNGASNWNDPNSYTDTSFVPNGHEDVVVIPENATVYLSSADTTSFNIMSNLSYLCFSYTNSVLEITVPEGGDALFDCKFKGLWEPNGNGQFYSGLIVKKGKGRITAGDGSKYPEDTTIYGQHQMPVRVEEGIWRLPQNIPGTKNAYEYMSAFHVEEGATICLSTGNPSFYNQFSRLTGKGTITTGDSVKRQFRIIDQQYGGPSRFEGVFDEGVSYFASARVFLEGTNSLMAYAPTVFGAYGSYATNTGYTAVMKFGMTGEPSSIGTNGVVEVNVRGGGWGYLGNGETTDKEFRWYPYQADGVSYVSMLLDGGAHGGLHFTGRWSPVKWLYGIGSIVLTGSNTVSACVVDCPIESSWHNICSNPVSVVKTGTGKWRFKHNKARKLLGVFDIQQGTLQADSIEEMGVQSALGFATNLYVEGYANNNNEVPPADKRVTDYAMVLGAEASDSIAGVATEGTLEYTGTNSAYCFTRPYVLDGDARLKNSTSHRFWTGKVRSRSAGAKTLTLDGTDSRTNTLADVTDAAGGAISLVKDGPNTWIVTGTNDIRGDIAVKAGTLILQNINGQPYTWHKWQIRSNYATSTTPDGNTIKIRPCEFALFNASGVRVNSGLTYCGEYQDLEPGQAAYATHFKRYGEVWVQDTGGLPNLARLFDGKSSNAGLRIGYRSVVNDTKTGLVPQEDKPETWQTVMMRLAEGAGEAASWDYSDYYGLTGVEGGTRQMNIKTSALYGSANGANWELLDLASNVPMRDSTGRWAFDGRGVPNGHTNCNTIASRVAQNAYPFLNNMAGAVSVASGAELVCKGAQITFAKIRLDAAGAGTIRGAAFAAAGELSVENVQTKDEIVFSGLFDGCATAANVARWTIRENGQPTTRRRALVRGNDLRLVRKGICVNFR